MESLTDRKGLIQSAVYIEGRNLSEEEQAQEWGKFKAWYAAFQEEHGEELARIRSLQNGGE